MGLAQELAVPLYYSVPDFSSVLHCNSPPFLEMMYGIWLAHSRPREPSLAEQSQSLSG
jgi:hypothetical protein